MELRELLDELRGNVLRDVSTVVNGDPDELWSDATLVRYLRDAEEKFVAGTLCLRDSLTPAVSTITLVSGQADYVLDKRVIDIYNAQFIGADNNRTLLTPSSYGTRAGSLGELTPNVAMCDPQETGQPRLYYTDRDTGMVGFYPIPGDDQVPYTIRLQVARRPLNPLNANDLDASPEIPDEYHLDLVEWACWRALRNHDADIDGDPANIAIVMARASAHKKRFEEAIAECKRKMKYMTKQLVQFGPHANWS